MSGERQGTSFCRDELPDKLTNLNWSAPKQLYIRAILNRSVGFMYMYYAGLHYQLLMYYM